MQRNPISIKGKELYRRRNKPWVVLTQFYTSGPKGINFVLHFCLSKKQTLFRTEQSSTVPYRAVGQVQFRTEQPSIVPYRAVG